MSKHWPEWKEELAALGLKPTVGETKESGSGETAPIDHQENEHQLHTWVKQLVYRYCTNALHPPKKLG